MPTKRFHNLSEEKQQRITDAAIDELADKGMDGATVARIVERAQIPRGSFYQYFESMDDLIDYVIDLIKRAKIAYLGDIMNQVGMIPFLDFYRDGFRKALEFAYDYPRFLAIGSHFYSSKGQKAGELARQIKDEGVSFYSELIENDKRKGLVRSDVDSGLVASLLLSLSSDSVLERLYCEHRSTDEIMTYLEKVIDVIKHGISIKGRENND